MSLNSLASSAVHLRPFPSAPSSDDTVRPKLDAQNAMSALVEYLPAETVTLYLAAMSSLPALGKVSSRLDARLVYWTFAILTPVLFALIFIGKRRGAQQPALPPLREWPWWQTLACTIAFLAWGLVVPDGPYLNTEHGRVLATLIAIIASALLGVLGRIFRPAP